MTYRIEIRDIVSHDKSFKAYYLVGEYPLDDNEIFLGVMGECIPAPHMCHVSFVRYRESPEMVDVTILTSDIDKVFQFYADYVNRKADEYLESHEWQNQIHDQSDGNTILNG